MNDNDNNQIIDFSNQPLGLMAQEGSKIEENLNREYAENEAKRMNNKQAVGMQQNDPFAQISPPSTEPPAIMMNPPIIENSSDIAVTDFTSASPNKTDSNIGMLNQQPVDTPSASDNHSMETNIGNVNISAEEARKEEMMKELMGEGKGSETSPSEGQPSSWGVFVFLILIAFVVGAFILFKTGKIDKLFAKEETKEVESEPSNNNTSQPKPENKPTEPVEQPKEVIKTYRIKETSYLAAGDTMTITSTGDVDIENNVSYLIMTVNYKGLTSRNLENYNDYSKGISYTFLDMGGYNGWYYDNINKRNISLDELLKHVQSLGTSQEVSKDNYKIVLSKNDLLNILDSKSGYYDLNKIINGDAVVEYTLDNGNLKKIRYDLSNASKDYNKFIIQQDFSDYNVPKSISIPDKVINSAKKFK